MCFDVFSYVVSLFILNEKNGNLCIIFISVRYKNQFSKEGLIRKQKKFPILRRFYSPDAFGPQVCQNSESFHSCFYIFYYFFNL